MFTKGFGPRSVVNRHRVGEGSVAIEDKGVKICVGQDGTPWGLVWHAFQAMRSFIKLQKKTGNRGGLDFAMQI